MRFMLLMFTNPDETKAMSSAQLAAIEHKHEELRTELTRSAELLSGAGVEYAEETTTMRLVDGVATSSHGPLAKAEVHMSAYYVVECEDAGRAAEIAARLLDFHVLAVEVRAVHNSVGIG